MLVKVKVTGLKGVFDSTPKTASSRRVIHIDDDIAELLRNHKQWQDSEAVRLGTYWKNSGKVFTADDGRPINPGTVTKWFYDFVAENNLPDVCLHSLRHQNTMKTHLLNYTNLNNISLH